MEILPCDISKITTKAPKVPAASVPAAVTNAERKE